jgi:hypothetical protein
MGTRERRRNNLGKDILLYESNDWMVSLPLDQNSMIYYSRHTNWCLSAPELFPKVFDFFSDIAPILIAVPKKPNYIGEKYSLVFACFVLPSFLLKVLHSHNAITESLSQNLSTLGITEEIVKNIVVDNIDTTSEQENLIWESYYSITKTSLSGILNLLGNELSSLKSLADLINPINLYPNDYMQLSEELIGNNVKIGVIKIENNDEISFETLKQRLGNEYEPFIKSYIDMFPELKIKYDMFLRYAK